MNKIILKCTDDKSLEFNYNSEYGHFYSKENEDLVFHYMTAEGLTLNSKLESLNPQSLHFIEEKDWPYCEGKGMINTASFSGETNYCKSCNHTGKISEETFFIIFGKSQEEYDAEIFNKGYKKRIEVLKNRELNSEQENKI